MAANFDLHLISTHFWSDATIWNQLIEIGWLSNGNSAIGVFFSLFLDVLNVTQLGFFVVGHHGGIKLIDLRKYRWRDRFEAQRTMKLNECDSRSPCKKTWKKINSEKAFSGSLHPAPVFCYAPSPFHPVSPRSTRVVEGERSRANGNSKLNCLHGEVTMVARANWLFNFAPLEVRARSRRRDCDIWHKNVLLKTFHNRFDTFRCTLWVSGFEKDLLITCITQ